MIKPSCSNLFSNCDRKGIDHVEGHVMKDEPARVLIVDDEPHICELLARWLIAEGYRCATAFNADKALELMKSGHFDLALCDIMMPGMDGLGLLNTIRTKFNKTAVLMVTAVDDRRTGILAVELGAYGYVIKPFERNEILIHVADALERRSEKLLSQEYAGNLAGQLEKQVGEARDREQECIFRLLSGVSFRTDETIGHMRRVGMYSSALLKEAVGWEVEEVNDIAIAAAMHDVGKIRIDETIMRNPGKLSPEQFEIMKQHTEFGADILADSNHSMLQMAKDIALYHHENYDGSGYPRRLSGDDIPEYARIVAIADVYDSITHDRIYRPALSEEEALNIMNSENGKRFDPRLFDCFLRCLPELRRIRSEIKE
jgi:putative two-component system response regulator